MASLSVETTTNTKWYLLLPSVSFFDAFVQQQWLSAVGSPLPILVSKDSLCFHWNVALPPAKKLKKLPPAKNSKKLAPAKPKKNIVHHPTKLWLATQKNPKKEVHV